MRKIVRMMMRMENKYAKATIDGSHVPSCKAQQVQVIILHLMFPLERQQEMRTLLRGELKLKRMTLERFWN